MRDSGYVEAKSAPVGERAKGVSEAFEAVDGNLLFDCAAVEHWKGAKMIAGVCNTLTFIKDRGGREHKCRENQLVRRLIANLGVGYDPS